ncbi:hydantoinase/carbamoylase family amidase [Methylobacterium sp. J-067]|uniref:hydantoinase/carbamoylase family amidase n=1 Tax=Methylobacterium sp. J-067 TaxID=2836648 RepID=UPI001FB9A7AF|nr:hydantoinase/carbamoylase family amidase [Methylobacterium sp. J-067]MCJ2026922.1 hydantoinase/carbamoylase family amidase [Methylobacterium sp. J-067]
MSATATIIERIERLARISAYPWNLTRRVFSPEQTEAEGLVRGWMEEAGLTTRRDPIGNLIGRVEGSVPGGPAVVIGGHIDTRKDASRYDGTLGLLTGIAAVGDVIRGGAPWRHAIEVVALVTDAAGRFGLPRPGSRAVVGRLDRDALDLDDDYGVTLHEALQSQGLDPKMLPGARRSADAIVAYLEIAAEAGPVLDWAGSPVGIVPALSASSILRVALTGQAVGAATVPTSGRRDALSGMAECILDAERIGSARKGVTVTVMRVDVESMSTFTVTGRATFGVCILSCDDAERNAAVTDLVAAFEGIAARRRLEIGIDMGIDPDATRCEPGIVRLFERAVEAAGHPPVRLAQGVATDAANMALLGPVGLALIRCRGGVGWGAAGVVETADIQVGLNVLTSVLATLTSGTSAPP